MVLEHTHIMNIDTIDLDILDSVAGGNDPVVTASQGEALSHRCGTWLKSLAANDQVVPQSFAATCGTLRPDIRAGERVVANRSTQAISNRRTGWW
jgi:hypothetical protein